MNVPLPPPPEFERIPGYRFIPTDAELVECYLKRKVLFCPLPLDIPILDDVYSYSPFQLLLKKDWHQHSQKVSTEREVKSVNEVVGFVQTSTFYCGEPPNGHSTDWILEEFRLNPNAVRETNHIIQKRIQNIVVCKIFRDLPFSDTDTEYKGGHAIRHWKETQHCYSLELETQRVWDYDGDNYVHRLIQSKTDGKLVELNTHCLQAKDGCGSCGCVDSGISEALISSKVEAIVNEYNELLVTQLENQKLFESLLQEVKEETEDEISEAVKKAVSQKLQKLQAKLERCLKEKMFLDDLNENLLENQEIWKAKILEIGERERKVLKVKDDKIRDLEEQLRDLMVYLEAGKTVEQLSISDGIKDATILAVPVEIIFGEQKE